MDLLLKKLPNGTLAPDDEETVEALSKLKVGEVIAGKYTRPRNVHFHRKLFALLHYAFDMWEPDPALPEKNFERFRKDVTCLAGYYYEVVNLRGEVRAEPQSISFAAMDELEFGRLYEAVLQVLLKWVLKTHTREDVDRVMTHLLEFAA